MPLCNLVCGRREGLDCTRDSAGAWASKLDDRSSNDVADPEVVAEDPAVGAVGDEVDAGDPGAVSVAVDDPGRVVACIGDSVCCLPVAALAGGDVARAGSATGADTRGEAANPGGDPEGDAVGAGAGRSASTSAAGARRTPDSAPEFSVEALAELEKSVTWTSACHSLEGLQRWEGRREISDRSRAPALGCNLANGNWFSSNTTSREI